MSEWDHEPSIMRMPWPTGGCCAMKKNVVCLLMIPSVAQVVLGLIVWRIVVSIEISTDLLKHATLLSPSCFFEFYEMATFVRIAKLW